jgi:5'-deoxynucleotidase YfbR-like HD superfamily hydrolase
VLQSGAELNLLEPASCPFTIEDIAHGLAMTCRYAGQCRIFYSVAEHSVHLSHLAGGRALEALLHDAAEAFIGDVSRPLKQLLPEYKALERSLEAVIRARFGLEPVCSPEIKALDLSALATEQAQIMPAGANRWASVDGVQMISLTVEGWPPERAKQAFLDRFEDLAGWRSP